MTLIRVPLPTEPKPPVDTRTQYYNQNESITSGGEPLQGQSSIYYAPMDADIVVAAEIVDSEGVVQTQLDQIILGFPPILKLPINKYIGGRDGQIVDEVYFNATLADGVITAVGQIPESGDWKLTTDRLNLSIQAIGGEFKIDREDITFLV